MKKYLYLFVNYHLYNLFVFLSFLEITFKSDNFQLRNRKKKFKKKEVPDINLHVSRDINKKQKLLCNVMEVHKIGIASCSTYLGTFLKYINIIFCIILSILYFFFL